MYTFQVLWKLWKYYVRINILLFVILKMDVKKAGSFFVHCCGAFKDFYIFFLTKIWVGLILPEVGLRCIAAR